MKVKIDNLFLTLTVFNIFICICFIFGYNIFEMKHDYLIVSIGIYISLLIILILLNFNILNHIRKNEYKSAIYLYLPFSIILVLTLLFAYYDDIRIILFGLKTVKPDVWIKEIIDYTIVKKMKYNIVFFLEFYIPLKYWKVKRKNEISSKNQKWCYEIKCQMKKNLRLLCLVLFGFILIFTIKNRMEEQKFLNMLKEKYFITMYHLMEKKTKIIIFDGKTKILEIDAKDAASILSIENGKIIYLETLVDEIEIKKSFIVDYDIKSKKVIRKTVLPVEYEENVPTMTKINDSIYFSSSADWLHVSYTDEETNLYEYNLITKKLSKILTYSGQGLPIIKENEIIYSKDNKIYLFNRLTNKSEYLFDGKLPFNYADGEIFYVKNGKIMKNKNGKEIIKYEFRKNMKLGGYPVKINDDLFLAVELKWTEDKFNTYYGELKMMDSKNRKEFDMYKLYYKNLEKFPFLKNDTFMLVDKSLLKEYLE